MEKMKEKEKLFILEAELSVPYEKTEIQTYSVKAGSLEDAKKIFLKKKKKENGTIKCIDLRNKTSAWPGIISFSIAVFLSLMPYYEHDGFKSVFLFPNMSALLVSLVLYSSFVIKVKGMENTFKNVKDSIISLLCILVLAIFIKIFLRDSIPPGSVIGRITKLFKLNNSYTLVAAAAILSWIGMKSVAGIIWVIIAGLGILQLVTAGNIMGEYTGAIFILSSFSGFIFYLKYEGKLIINSFKTAASKAMNSVASDINDIKKPKKTVKAALNENKNIENKEIKNENK